MDDMEKLKSFWRGKRVFITGNTGFKGSWLSLVMLNLGAEVKGFSLKPEKDKSLYVKLKLEDNSNSIYGDIRNEKLLTDELRSFKPEIVFHMAAQPLVRRSYLDPLETISTNVVGTFNVMQACRSVDSIKSVISVTTDKCYLNKEWEYSYRENDNLGGHDPYSASKACAEIITSSMRDSFFKDREIGISTVRAGNVIGGGDFSEDRLFPDIIKSIFSGEKLIIRNPLATRPWQHVLEPLFAYIELAKNQYNSPEKFSSAWNVGPDSQNAKSVGFILDNINFLYPGLVNWKNSDNDEPHEAQLLQLDSSKFKNKNVWVPKWDLPETIKITMDWYVSDLEGVDSLELCEKNIKKYLAR
jgi:CDP-glucose 4,6-dehydratase